MKRFLESIVAGVLLGIAGCSSDPHYAPKEGEKVDLTSVMVRPTAVDCNWFNDGNTYQVLLTFVGSLDGDTFIGYSWTDTGDNFTANFEAKTLIQSEIDDRDSEQVKLTGHYVKENHFRIVKVEANERTVKLVKE